MFGEIWNLIGEISINVKSISFYLFADGDNLDKAIIVLSFSS